MRICIIGAGIGGSCAALKLAAAGRTVVLIDKAKAPMSRTSAMNPGRSALGFHYTDLATGYQMIEGSNHFDCMFCDMRIEDPGARYFVVKDSQVSAEEYLHICQLLQAKYPDLYYRVLHEQEYEDEVDKNQIVLGIQTKEQLINIPKLVATINHQLKEAKNITILTDHEVVDAKKEGEQFELFFKNNPSVKADRVINAAWEYRHKIDSFLGHKPSFDFTNRLKVLAKVQLPDNMVDTHSMMFVRGPFAMMANSRDGTAFCTYAPVTNYSQTAEIAPPEHWEQMITSDQMTEEKKVLGNKIVEGVSGYIPNICHATLLEVRAGVIYSEGDADPFDPQSAMHARDKSGISELMPGWFSLDTGKLILGPYYASQLVEMLK